MTDALHNSICPRQAGQNDPAGATPVFFGYYWWRSSPVTVDSALELPS